MIEKFGWDRAIGLGVIDVKSAEVETPTSSPPASAGR